MTNKFTNEAPSDAFTSTNGTDSADAGDSTACILADHLIGNLWFNLEALQRIASILDPEEVYAVASIEAATVYAEMCRLLHSPDRQLSAGQLEVSLKAQGFNKRWLGELQSRIDADSIEKLEDYARGIKDAALKKNMIPVLQQATRMCRNGTDFGSVYDYIQTELSGRNRQSPQDGWVVEDAFDLTFGLPKPRKWFLKGLIYKGQTIMIFGPPGIKKTLLLMNMCMAMAAGQNWLVRRSGQDAHESLVTFHREHPARILWLDFDNGRDETQKRVRAAMQIYQEMTRGNFHYMSEVTPWLELDNQEHVQNLIKIINDNQFDVVVIDALGLVLGTVDENSPDMGRVMAKLKEIRSATGATLIIVHHPSKAGARMQEASGYNASGHAKLANFFEWLIELRAGEEPDTIVAEIVKNRGWAGSRKFAASFSYDHFGPEHPELAHELQSFTFYPKAIMDRGEQRVTIIRDAVVAALQGGKRMNQKDLVHEVKADVGKALGSPVGSVAIRDIIEAMVDDGTIQAIQSAPRQPKFYSLDDVVDCVDSDQ